MELQVVLLTSVKTQIPFDYYHAPYCPSTSGTRSWETENLGEVLMGDKIAPSPYELKMKTPVPCKVLCRKNMTEADMKNFQNLVDNEYKVHMQLDGLPVAIHEERLTSHGFPVGYPMKDGTRYIFKHLSFVVKYHEANNFTGSRIVGFEVVAKSKESVYGSAGGVGEDREGGSQGRRRERNLAEDEQNEEVVCPEKGNTEEWANFVLQSVEAPQWVTFTYDVEWEKSDTPWAERWDQYIKGNPEKEIHYFSIVNSLMIMLFLTGVVAMIMLKTVKRDISNYNETQTVEDTQDESGWKLVHGDVFRPPSFSPMLLSVLCGSGMQVLAMTLSTITFAFMGFLSPANRGGMLTAILVLFVLMGSFAGYWSATMYKFFNGKKWKRSTLATALVFPSVVFAIYWSLDVMVWTQQSSTAINVPTFVLLLFLWFFVSMPLVFVGSYFGFRAETYTIPVRVNQIARHVPEQTWHTHPAFAIALGGILPFGAVCIELFFIMSALWMHQIYYVYSFLYVVFFILMVTCAEITMVMCYFQLCNEDYRWWWRAFLSAGSSAGYLFVYSTWFFYSKLPITGFVSTMVYFGYMMVIALTFFLLTGSCGFFACFWFVRKIYSAIKVD